ncbi:hypothetical protein QNI19_32110 [Cytophagaceae bacterium DM2B3-1]|uniref:Killer suppression protein HigA n=1 Tax=Xanthocytophaga flava TaxID=3048013 RepID=A0ABT7CV34_9BACT|nr:hypothetical protein [Xanthocytophaga flavus]MDJ1497628.1 hypothetical protein [Xanthocytophaga flavus]
MELTFLDSEIRQICQVESKAIEVYGKETARKLQSRLSDLEAADSVWELPAGAPTPISDSEYKITIDKNLFLIFCANNRRQPKDTNGKIDWQRVSIIKILKLENR